MAAAAVAALFLIALVAFNAWPSGGGQRSAQEADAAAAQTAPAAGTAAATALAPGASSVAAAPAPVQLAQRGNPNSVITPGDIAPGGANATPGGSSQAGGGGSAPGGQVTTVTTFDNPVTGLVGSVTNQTTPVVSPLLVTVAGLGGTVEQLLDTTTPGLLDTAAPGLTDALNHTTGNLLAPKQAQQTPQPPGAPQIPPAAP